MLSTPEELMDYLPRPFKYAIMQFDYIPASDFNIDSFVALVRTDMTQAYWPAWLEEFSVNTKTRWILRYSTMHNHGSKSERVRQIIKNRGQRVSFATTVLCQHSNYGKNRGNKIHRHGTKGCGCEAYIKVKTQEDSVRNRRNPLWREGLATVITLHFRHNHAVGTPDAVSYLQPTNQLRETFEYYFNELGMTTKEACQYHEAMLRSSEYFYEDLLLDRTENPAYSTALYWFNKWLKKQADLGLEPPQSKGKYRIGDISGDMGKKSTDDPPSADEDFNVDVTHKGDETLEEEEEDDEMVAGPSTSSAVNDGKHTVIKADTIGDLHNDSTVVLDSHDYAIDNDTPEAVASALPQLLADRIAQFYTDEAYVGMKRMMQRLKGIATPEMLTQFFLTDGVSIIPAGTSNRFIGRSRRPEVLTQNYAVMDGRLSTPTTASFVPQKRLRLTTADEVYADQQEQQALVEQEEQEEEEYVEMYS